MAQDSTYRLTSAREAFMAPITTLRFTSPHARDRLDVLEHSAPAMRASTLGFSTLDSREARLTWLGYDARGDYGGRNETRS